MDVIVHRSKKARLHEVYARLKSVTCGMQREYGKEWESVLNGVKCKGTNATSTWAIEYYSYGASR